MAQTRANAHFILANLTTEKIKTEEKLELLDKKIYDIKTKIGYWVSESQNKVVMVVDMSDDHILRCLRICIDGGFSKITSKCWNMDKERMQSFVSLQREAHRRGISETEWINGNET